MNVRPERGGDRSSSGQASAGRDSAGSRIQISGSTDFHTTARHSVPQHGQILYATKVSTIVRGHKATIDTDTPTLIDLLRQVDVVTAMGVCGVS
jgi:hypothetical protein